MKKIYLLCALIFAFQFVLVAQNQTLFDENKQEMFLMQIGSGDSPASIKYLIFSKMAKANSQSVNSVQFNISYKQQCKIVKRGSFIDVDVRFSDISLRGNTEYRRFQMSETLIPQSVDLQVKLYDGKRMLKMYDYRDVYLSGNQPYTIANFSASDTIANAHYRIEISNQKFEYSTKNLSDFDSKAKLIDDYYTADTQIKKALSGLQTINIDKLDSLDRYKERIEDYENLVKNLKNKDFNRKLSLSTNDPADLNRNLTFLQQQNSKMLQTVEDQIKRLPEIYYNRGIDALTAGNTNNAEFNFQLSIKQNNLYAPSHYQIAAITYQRSKYDEALEMLHRVIKQMNPDKNTLSQTYDLAQKIYNQYLQNAHKQNAAAKFENALVVLNKAANICQTITQVACSEELKSEYTIAHFGIYRAFISDAEKHLINNNLANAEKALNSANDFQSQHNDYIADNKELTKPISSLYDKYMRKAKDFSNASKFNEALEEFYSANRVCTKYSALVSCTPDLESGIFAAKTGVYKNMLAKAEDASKANRLDEAEKLIDDADKYQQNNRLEKLVRFDALLVEVKQKRYNNWIQEANSLYASAQYKQSLSKFDDAKRIEIKFSLKADKALDGYITKAARALIISNIDEGKAKVAVNQLVAAKTAYAEAKSLQEKYLLQSDSEITNEISNLKNKIFTQECANAQNAFDKQFATAKQLAEQKKFIEADAAFDATLTIALQYSDCGIVTTLVINKKAECLPGAVYQKKINSANDFLRNGNYQQCIDTYVDAGSYFEKNNVSKLGLTFQHPYEYIVNSNEKFIYFAVQYYIDKQDFTKAFLMLDELRKRDLGKRDTKDYQTVIGTELAKIDKANNSENMKEMLENYTKGERWFKFFAKAYKAQWKK